MAAFIASTRILDRSVGDVLARWMPRAWQAHNGHLYDRSWDGFPGMKCNLTDHGTGVMLIMRGPAGFSGGRVCDALVSQVDLFPTVCDLAGQPQPAGCKGARYCH